MIKKEEYLELVRRCQYPMTKELAIVLRKEFAPFVEVLEKSFIKASDKIESLFFRERLTSRVLELYDEEGEEEKGFFSLALFLFYVCYKRFKIKTDKEQGFSSAELNTTCDSCLNYKTCGIQGLSICQNFNTRFYKPLF